MWLLKVIFHIFHSSSKNLLYQSNTCVLIASAVDAAAVYE